MYKHYNQHQQYSLAPSVQSCFIYQDISDLHINDNSDLIAVLDSHMVHWFHQKVSTEVTEKRSTRP
jgi:hypothetical protein